MTARGLAPKTVWMLRGGLLTLPWVALLALGGFWLWEHGYALWFATITAVLVMIAWFTQQVQRSQRVTPQLGTPGRIAEWPPAGKTAWSKLEAKSGAINIDEFRIDDPGDWWNLFRDSVSTVASEFSPHSRDPMLEVPVPDVLKIAELVAADLRQALITQVPGAHVLTVNDLRRIHAAAQWLPALARLYRIGAFLANPAAGMAREAGNFLQDRVLQSSSTELKQWLVGFLIRQTGTYAIELYSGGLLLDSKIASADATTESPVSASPQSSGGNSTGTPPPLRVLVCGQVKAGKSSLINALFGDIVPASSQGATDRPDSGTHAMTDVLPTTSRVVPHQWTASDDSGLPAAIIIDTPGYADVTLGATARNLVHEELPQSDLVLLVVSAQSAARQADRAMLDELRQVWRERPDRIPASTLVALTHIDLLRPHREWSPPYDIAQPQSAKAQSIRAVVDAVAADLGLESGDVIPVCTHPERLYNVHEGLLPAILEDLPEVRRAAALRSFRDRKQAESWSLWGQQARATGQLLAKVGARLGQRAIQEARAAADRYLFDPPKGNGQ